MIGWNDLLSLHAECNIATTFHHVSRNLINTAHCFQPESIDLLLSRRTCLTQFPFDTLDVTQRAVGLEPILCTHTASFDDPSKLFQPTRKRPVFSIAYLWLLSRRHTCPRPRPSRILPRFTQSRLDKIGCRSRIRHQHCVQRPFRSQIECCSEAHSPQSH